MIKSIIALILSIEIVALLLAAGAFYVGVDGVIESNRLGAIVCAALAVQVWLLMINIFSAKKAKPKIEQ